MSWWGRNDLQGIGRGCKLKQTKPCQMPSMRG